MQKTSESLYSCRIVQIVTRRVSVQQGLSRGRNYRLSSPSSWTRSLNWMFRIWGSITQEIALRVISQPSGYNYSFSLPIESSRVSVYALRVHFDVHSNGKKIEDYRDIWSLWVHNTQLHIFLNRAVESFLREETTNLAFEEKKQNSRKQTLLLFFDQKYAPRTFRNYDGIALNHSRISNRARVNWCNNVSVHQTQFQALIELVNQDLINYSMLFLDKLTYLLDISSLQNRKSLIYGQRVSASNVEKWSVSRLVRTHRTIDSRTTLRRWPITVRRVNYGW